VVGQCLTLSLQVEEMQKSLAVKSQELQQKNEAANAKLKQMFKDQQEAEKKKVQSQAIQLQLAEQTVKIEEKRKDVMTDLELVEPAVIDAQTGKPFVVQVSIDFLDLIYLISRVYYLF
jgi:phosphoenolpyruvate synthase/pyruvate phosphate dikinase